MRMEDSTCMTENGKIANHSLSQETTSHDIQPIQVILIQTSTGQIAKLPIHPLEITVRKS